MVITITDENNSIITINTNQLKIHLDEARRIQQDTRRKYDELVLAILGPSYKGSTHEYVLKQVRDIRTLLDNPPAKKGR